MGKIGDLWVRLGLKKQDFDKGLADASKEVKGFGAKLGALKGVAAGAFAAMGAAIAKFVKDARNLTQTWGDSWNVTIAGIRGAYDALVRQLASGEGFSNLFANMRESARIARELAADLDELFERKTSFSYQEAITQREISALELIMHDTSKTDKEREDAAKRIIELNKELGKTKRDIAVQEQQDMRKATRDATKLNDDQLDFLVAQYNQNREAIKQARAYNEERQKLQRSYKQLLNSNDYKGWAQEVKDQLDALDASTSQSIKDVAKLTEGYDRANDKLIAGMAAADVAVIKVDTDINNANRRANSMAGRLSAAGPSTPASDPAADQAGRIARRAADAAQGEIMLLMNKYSEEKALLVQYGYDTEELTKEYFERLHALEDKYLGDMVELVEEVEPAELDIIDEDYLQQELDGITDQYKKAVDDMYRLGEEINRAMVDGISSGIQELTDQLLGLESINPGRVFQALLSPLADLAVREGEIVLATGLGVEAVKTSLEALQGVDAIAAGAALIAIGAAAKSGLAALAKGGSGTTANYSGAGAGAGGGQTIRSELVVRVEGTIKGRDIVISGQNTLKDQRR